MPHLWVCLRDGEDIYQKLGAAWTLGLIGEPVRAQLLEALQHEQKDVRMAILSGLHMVTLRGWPLLLLGVIGVLGAWGYTGGQINYKNRGLGIVLVFFLMGALLIGGSYYVVMGSYHQHVFWISLPFSLLSSLLLLSNELRDYEDDMAEGIKTLTVRLGYPLAVKLYYGMVALIYFSSALLYQAGYLKDILLVVITLLALWQPFKILKNSSVDRYRLTPLTGRFYFLFSLAFITSLWVPVL